MKGYFRNLIKYLFFSILIVYIFFAVLDFSSRVFKYFIYDDFKKFCDIKSGKALFRQDKYLGHALNPNYKSSDGIISINNLGFRDDEVQKQKDETVFRIIVLGDSIAFGYSEADNYEAWPNKLEILLNENKKDNQKRFEVINAGVIGYTSIQALRFFESKLIELDPDMIIVSIGWNDLIFSTYQKWYPEISIRSGSRMKFIRRLDNFMFVKLIKELYTRIIAFFKMVHPQKVLVNEKAPISFEYNLTEIIRTAESKGIKVVLTTMPTLLHNNMSDEEKTKAQQKTFKTIDDLMMTFEKFNNVIKKVALANNALIMESQFSSLNKLDKNRFFIDYCHFNEEGNGEFAKEIYKRLYNLPTI